MAAFHLTIMSISFNLNLDREHKFRVLSKIHSETALFGGRLVHPHSEPVTNAGFSADLLSLGG